MKKFFVLDASGYLFRAYFALPELTNQEWENQNAVFGFFRMLLKLFQENPDYFLITWDHPWKTKRHSMYEQYKANRPEVPDDFKNQIKNVKKTVQELNIPNIEIEWYEADDIIKTITRNNSLQNLSTIIVSSDKDLKQLVEKNVLFYEPMKGKYSSEDDILSLYGFKPQYILDYLALVGDSSDNVPWVNWIWEKTAQKLIKEYGTLENLYQNLDNIDQKTAEKLTQWKENAFAGKELIKLYDIPDLNNEDVSRFSFSPDMDKIKSKLVDEFGFKSVESIINNLKKSYSGGKQESLF